MQVGCIWQKLQRRRLSEHSREPVLYEEGVEEKKNQETGWREWRMILD